MGDSKIEKKKIHKLMNERMNEIATMYSWSMYVVVHRHSGLKKKKKIGCER